MLLGVGVLAVAGYLLWKQSQKPKSFANLMANPGGGGSGACGRGTGQCCKASKCKGGSCKCCKGFEEPGTKAMGCGGNIFGGDDYATAEMI